MSTDTSSSLTAAPPPELVGESWPPIGGLEPVRAWPIPWLFAPVVGVLAAFFPRLLGPYLVRSSWPAAYFAHVVCVIYAVGLPAEIIVTARSNGSFPPATDILFQDPRNPLAALGLLVMSVANSPQAAELFLAIAVLALFPWVAAPLVLQFVGVGQTRRLAYLQSAKLLLWSTCWTLPAMTISLILAEKIDRWSGTRDTSGIVLGFAGLWWLFVVVRLSGRYGGPAVGPRWAVRTPRCEGCGYSLTGLRIDAQCPECGRPVGRSMPGARVLPDFARGWGLAPIGFARSFLQGFLGQHLGEQAAIWSGLRSAHWFAFYNYALIALLLAQSEFLYWTLLGALPRANLLLVENSLRRQPFFQSLMTGLGGAAIALALVSLVRAALCGFGFRDAARQTVPVSYSLPRMVVAVALAVAGGWLTYVAKRAYPNLGYYEIRGVGRIEILLAIGALFQLPALAMLGMWGLGIRRLLHASRFANS